MSTLSTAANAATHQFTNVALVQQYANSIKGLNVHQAQLALSTKYLSDKQKEQILVQAGLKASEDAIQGELIQSTLIQKGLNKEQINSILINSGVMDIATKKLIAEKACTKADLEAALAQELKNKVDEEGILATLGLGESNKFTAGTFKVLKKEIAGATASTAGIAGIVGIVVIALSALSNALSTSTKELQESLSNSISEMQEADSEIASLKSKISENISLIQEMKEAGASDIAIEKYEQENRALENQLKLMQDIKDASVAKNASITSQLVNNTGKQSQFGKALDQVLAFDLKGAFNTYLDNMALSTFFRKDVSTKDKLWNTLPYLIPGGFVASMANQFVSKTDPNADIIKNTNEKIEELSKLEAEFASLDKIDNLDEWKKKRDEISSIKGEIGTNLSELLEYKSTLENDPDSDLYTHEIDLINDVLENYAKRDPSSAIDYYINEDEFKNIRDKIYKLLDDGNLNQDTLEELWKTEGFKVFTDKLKEAGINSAKDFLVFFDDFSKSISGDSSTTSDSSANSHTKMISSINDLSEGFEELDKIYSSIKDDDPFDFKLLDDKAFKETFSDLDSYADFIEQITSNSDDIEACKSAFNDLVSEWINTSGILNNITEENEKLTIAMLKQMGVANAEEITAKELAKTKAKISAEEEFLAKKKEDSSIKSKDLTSATYEEISALWAESNASQATKQYLAQLALSKLNVQNVKINTKSDIDNIIALANAAGTSAEYVNALKTALNNLTNKKSSAINTSKDIGANYLAYGTLGIKLKNKSVENDLKSAEEEVNSILANIQKNGLTASDFYANVDYAGGSSSNKNGGGSSKDTAETFDWIEIKLQRLQRVIENLGKIVSATWKSWTERNNALKDQLSAVTQEINLQANAANKYLSLANSVGLGEGYKSLVRNGTLDISTITDENTIDAIKQYQEYYENYLSALDAKQDAEDELRNLKQTSFDNIITQYEDQLAFIEHDMSILESTADLLENKGYMASASIYDKLIQQEDAKISSLEAKYKSLTNELASNGIQQGTEQWNDMKLEILEVEEAILESKNALVDYNNTLQELGWEVFDKLQDKISSITEEANFLIELMSDEKMFDEGKITEHGQATLGLHALNYKTYLEASEEFAKELAQIESELANDPYNQTLLERKNELLESQRDSILAAEDEKQSIKDLVSEGYDNLLSTMDEIIDKRKEMLNQIQDMYEYEKNIAELTKEVATLEKQEIAFRGDDSESGKAKYQQIKVSLEEARQNLEETEREKTISDIEKMLDTLRDETEEWTNSRLDNLDGLIADVIAQTETNTDSILKTLETETTEVGVTLTSEMEKIWGTNGTFTTSLNSVVDMFKQYFDSLQKESDKEADKTVASTPSGGSSGGSTTPTTPTPAPSTNTNSSSSSSSSSGWKSALVYSRYLGNKSALNTSTSIVDLLKSHDYSAAWNDRANLFRAMGGSGSYVGSSSQNRFMINTMKGAGFAQGGTIGNLIKATGEDGFVLARKGEGILTPENMKMLENVMMTMNPIVDSLAKLPSLPDMHSRYSGDTQVTFGDIQMYGVNDPVEFEKQLLHHMKNSRPVRMVMKDTTIGEALGKNSMIRYTR